MTQPIEYQKTMLENIYINLPGPQEPEPGMSGGELLPGFLAALYRMTSPEMKAYVDALCKKWNVHYKTQKG